MAPHIMRAISVAGAADAVVSEHHAFGGRGALDLAKAVIQAAQQPNDFRCLDVAVLSCMAVCRQQRQE